MVWVAAGVHKGPGNRDIDLRGKAVVVRSENGPATCVIDCEGKGRGFIFRNGEDERSKIQGFTIRNGRADLGAGIYIFSDKPLARTSPTIEDCILNRERASLWGGGIYCAHSLRTPVITGCRFLGNSSAYLGGAVYCGSGAAPTLRNGIFSGNSSVWRGAPCTPSAVRAATAPGPPRSSIVLRPKTDPTKGEGSIFAMGYPPNFQALSFGRIGPPSARRSPLTGAPSPSATLTSMAGLRAS